MNSTLAVLGLSGGELILMLICGLVVAIAAVACVFGGIAIVVTLARRSSAPQPPVSPQQPQSPATRTCPRCGAAIDPSAPQGLCPRCLMHAGVESQFSEAQKPSSPAPAPTELAGFFPQLEIIELLGQGGMGMVYKARQPQLDRFVALKILSPELSRDPAFAERFTREARALARLNHPNILSVYDFGQAGEFYYFIMEYVDGLNLLQMEQARKRLSPEEALAIVPKICDALQYAHDEGIVHRDIKPANILIDSKGRVKIADFGLAKLVGQESQLGLTQSQATMGTPQYMAPEQIEKPLQVDHRADIYSLGVVFYEMLTGELPLGRFQAPSAKVQMDVRLDEVVMRTLEKEPDRRYQKASQVKTDVETIVTTTSGIPSPAPTPMPQPTAAEHRPAPARENLQPQSDAQRQVSAPGTALMVLGVLQLFPALLAIAGLAALGIHYHSSPWELLRNGFGPAVHAVQVLMSMAGILMISGTVMIVAGRCMKQLNAYPLAIAASILAVMLPPLNVMMIALGIGIWCLVVLMRPEVRRAFAHATAGSPSPRRAALAMAVLLLVVVGLPLLGVVASIKDWTQASRRITRITRKDHGPVHVNVSTLLQSGPTQNCCLKLAKGLAVPAPEPLPLEAGDLEPALTKMHESGLLSDIDAVADPAHNTITFIDCRVMAIDNSDFSSILSQPNLELRLPVDLSMLHTVSVGSTPATFLVQNRSGNFGTIRLACLPEQPVAGEPRQMNVHYTFIISSPGSPSGK